MDHRDMLALMGNRRWEFNAKSMTLTLSVEGEDADGEYTETLTVPAVYEVCPSCDGRGSYVNPSIDAHGISSEEFAEDPDFAESYFSGAYDTECQDCHGLRVVPVPDEDKLSPTVKAAIEAHEKFLADSARERAAELRYRY